MPHLEYAMHCMLVCLKTQQILLRSLCSSNTCSLKISKKIKVYSIYCIYTYLYVFVLLTYTETKFSAWWLSFTLIYIVTWRIGKIYCYSVLHNNYNYFIWEDTTRCLASEVDHARHFQQANFPDMFSTQHNFHCIWKVWSIKTLLYLIINVSKGMVVIG